MNEAKLNEPDSGAAASKPLGSDPRLRPNYDAGTSESTREMRDTSRRRREAEVKLQQHLLEAKDHVPHDHEHQQDQSVPAEGQEARETETKKAEEAG